MYSTSPNSANAKQTNVSMDPSQSIPAAPAVVPANKAADDEQAAGGDGESIETFCEYKPTALPSVVIEACNGYGSNVGANDTENAVDKENSKKNDVVIDLVDDSDTDDDDDGEDRNTSLNDQVSTAQVQLLVPSHTSLTCESALLSSVRAPAAQAEAAKCLLPLLKPSGNKSKSQVAPLSPLQLEGVLLAIQRHRRIYTASGERAGFFLGDGAGVGKGRQIAAILRDCLCRSPLTTQQNGEGINGPTKNYNKRHLWLSVSRELIQDARRDLRDVGVHGCPVLDANVLLGNKKVGSKKEKGVLFLTYSFLVSSNRLEQLISWCAGTDHMKVTQSKSSTSATEKDGNSPKKERKTRMEHEFSGCIIFDESHKAKNLASDTKTAQLVLELQRRLPKARVVYCSATGVSDIAHMAYAERLGLWNTAGNNKPSSVQYVNGNGHGGETANVLDGHSKHYFNDFKAFQKSLESRGLGSLELLALELKGQGSFLARTLSWDGAEFHTTEVTLDKSQRTSFDRAAKWWTVCKQYLTLALKNTESNGSNRRSSLVWRIFWSAYQRFFRELAICTKVPHLAEDALKQVHQHNRCVVIGLQSTGEAGMQSLMGNYNATSLPFEEQEFPALWSTLAAVLTNLVREHFPVAPAPPEPPTLPNPPPLTASLQEHQAYDFLRSERARIAALPPHEPIPALVEMQKQLLHGIETLELPPNPLDDLIERFGGAEHVAELTGRSGRMVRQKNGKSFVYTKRVVKGKIDVCAADAGEESDRINLVERRHFMDGNKSFAIISDAASTGISLHSARGSGASHKRRVHYTLELPWSADKAVQQLGRSHRSGQETAPIYQLVVTELGGERRFAAAVSKRMASLGALTKGDRRAATGGDMLSEFDLDSKYGKRALGRFYSSLQSFRSEQERQQQDYSPIPALPSRSSKEILDQFVVEQVAAGKKRYVSSSPDDAIKMQTLILSDAIDWLDTVGLDADARRKPDVRTFLNRIFGLAVSKQQLIFSLFMSTLDDVIKEAKSSGEFEGTAEDIKAESIQIDRELDLAVDPSSGGQTKLTTLVLDRGISVETVCTMALEMAKKDKAHDDEGEGSANSGEEIDAEVEEDNEWLSKRPGTNVSSIATQGFYISRRKVLGRYLVLFARHKFDRSTFKNEQEATDFDPLGLLVITRPNTGTKLTDMTTSELNIKYRLAFSCQELHKQSLSDATQLSSISEEKASTDMNDKNEGDESEANPLVPHHATPYEVLMNGSKEVTKLWSEAYAESDHFVHKNGLPPRLAKLSLVTGPVLHILPELEKAVNFRSEKDRALKIMRAQVGSRLIVGVKFPSDEEAIAKLQKALDKLQSERNVSEGKTFTDEVLSPICHKSLGWVTTEPKTMKNFFSVVSKNDKSSSKSVSAATSTSDIDNIKSGSSPIEETSRKRRSPVAAAPTVTKTKKTKTIASFFTPKSTT